MNEQPQPGNRQQNSQGGEQSLYQATNSQPSTFSGYDLTQNQPAPTVGTPPPPVPPAAPKAHGSEAFSWEASEYVHHDKSALWYGGLVLLTVGLVAVAYFWTHSWTFIAVVIVMAIALGVYAKRPPQVLHYTLTDSGIQIDQKFYKFNEFRAFGILSDESLYSLMLIPTKRFMPAINLFFEEAQGEKIVDILGSRLPMQELHLDFMDRMMRRLRF